MSMLSRMYVPVNAALPISKRWLSKLSDLERVRCSSLIDWSVLSAFVATMTASMRERNPAKRNAFASLADRLDAQAAQRRPWW